MFVTTVFHHLVVAVDQPLRVSLGLEVGIKHEVWAHVGLVDSGSLQHVIVSVTYNPASLLICYQNNKKNGRHKITVYLGEFILLKARVLMEVVVDAQSCTTATTDFKPNNNCKRIANVDKTSHWLTHVFVGGFHNFEEVEL